jgi:hypothetical protein
VPEATESHIAKATDVEQKERQGIVIALNIGHPCCQCSIQAKQELTQGHPIEGQDIPSPGPPILTLFETELGRTAEVVLTPGQSLPNSSCIVQSDACAQKNQNREIGKSLEPIGIEGALRKSVEKRRPQTGQAEISQRKTPSLLPQNEGQR